VACLCHDQGSRIPGFAEPGRHPTASNDNRVPKTAISMVCIVHPDVRVHILDKSLGLARGSSVLDDHHIPFRTELSPKGLQEKNLGSCLFLTNLDQGRIPVVDPFAKVQGKKAGQSANSVLAGASIHGTGLKNGVSRARFVALGQNMVVTQNEKSLTFAIPHQASGRTGRASIVATGDPARHRTNSPSPRIASLLPCLDMPGLNHIHRYPGHGTGQSLPSGKLPLPCLFPDIDSDRENPCQFVVRHLLCHAHAHDIACRGVSGDPRRGDPPGHKSPRHREITIYQRAFPVQDIGFIQGSSFLLSVPSSRRGRSTRTLSTLTATFRIETRHWTDCAAQNVMIESEAEEVKPMPSKGLRQESALLSMKKKCIVLLSGGLDSAVCLAMTLERMNVACSLTFTYGQRSRDKEVDAASRLSRHYGIFHEIIDLPWLARVSQSALQAHANPLPQPDPSLLDDLESSKRSAESVWVPNRNGVFVHVAAALAEARSYPFIVAGFNAEEAASFPDNSVDFVHAMNRCLSFSTLSKVCLLSFTLKMKKEAIVRMAETLGVPLELSWSCYEGKDKPCRSCESCLRRARAFQLAGVLEE